MHVQLHKRLKHVQTRNFDLYTKRKNSYETFKTQNLQFIEYTYIVSN